MKSVSEPVLLALIAASGVVLAAAVTGVGLIIAQRLSVIHTAVNSRLTAALDLNHALEEDKRRLVEEKYQLREQLALAKQLQVATEQLPIKPKRKHP